VQKKRNERSRKKKQVTSSVGPGKTRSIVKKAKCKRNAQGTAADKNRKNNRRGKKFNRRKALHTEEIGDGSEKKPLTCEEQHEIRRIHQENRDSYSSPQRKTKQIRGEQNSGGGGWKDSSVGHARASVLTGINEALRNVIRENL